MPVPITEIRLNQALADLRDSIEGWQAGHGKVRQRYRQYVRHDIAAFRRARARHLAARSVALAADIAAAERGFAVAAE